MTEIWTIYFASRKLSQHLEKKHVRAYGSVSFLLCKYILNIILFLYPNPPQTRQTLATGVGFSGVGICQPTPTPVGTCSHNPCGFINPSYSLCPSHFYPNRHQHCLPNPHYLRIEQRVPENLGDWLLGELQVVA